MIYAGIGSRETPKRILNNMVRYAIILFKLGYTLRSGHADGADLAFEAGGGARAEIFIPWKKFNGSKSSLYVPSEAAFDLASKYHPNWSKLTYAIKLLHARNMHQILGEALDSPVEFVACYTKDASGKGGTGQALRLARDKGIPIYDFGMRENEKKFIIFLKNKIEMHKYNM